MPVSMSIDEKKRLLLKAFHEGAVVVVDEINSSPMMERFLNDLLMGKTPEGERPRIPGFLIIGTQNPVTMAGRRAASTALERRLSKAILTDYTSEEMKSILKSKGANEENATLLVNAFEKNVHKAKQQRLTPAPTFRDLLKFAKAIIREQASTQADNMELEEKEVKNSSRKRSRKKEPNKDTNQKRVKVSSEKKSEESTEPAARKRSREEEKPLEPSKARRKGKKQESPSHVKDSFFAPETKEPKKEQSSIRAVTRIFCEVSEPRP
jgi:hypothetical protein